MTDKPIINETEDETIISRRSVLAKLGLAGLAVYSAPVLLNLSDAEAGSRRKSKKKTKKTRRGKGGHKTHRKTKKTKKTKKTHRRTHRHTRRGKN